MNVMDMEGRLGGGGGGGAFSAGATYAAFSDLGLSGADGFFTDESQMAEAAYNANVDAAFTPLAVGDTYNGVTVLPISNSFSSGAWQSYFDALSPIPPDYSEGLTLSYNAQGPACLPLSPGLASGLADPWGDWSGLSGLAGGYAVVESYGDRFIVGGGLIVAGGGVAYAGVLATAGAFAAGPEAWPRMLFTGPVALAGFAMAVEGVDFLLHDDFLWPKELLDLPK
jgi:hypothetical protein